MSASSAILIASASLPLVYLRAADVLEPSASPSPPPPVRQPAFPDYGNEGAQFTPVIGDESSALRNVTASFLQDPFQLGPFRLRPHADYRVTYAEGVLRGPGRTEDTVEHSISPGITLQSPHVTLDYTPTLSYYTKGSYNDSLNHSASIRSAFGYGDWHFGVSHRYSRGSQAFVETGRQTDYETHRTGLSASFLYSEKTSVDLSLSQSINETGDFNNSKTWSTMNWVNYHYSEKVLFGAGVGGGYSDVQSGADMTFEQIQGRIGWFPGPKLSLHVNGGVEIRQFLGVTGASDLVNPIMGASVNYRLFEHTAFSLQANRSVGASLFADQVTESTRVSAAVSQRLLGRLNGTLSGGYTITDYQSSSQQFAVNRSDEVIYASARIGTHIFKKGNISVFYTRSENDSSLEGYSYASNQYGLQLGFQF